MADPKGLTQQDTRVRSSVTYVDMILLADLIPVAAADKNLQYDLNAIRSQLRRILGPAWTAAPPVPLSDAADQAFAMSLIGV